jgi:asparagine synthase (glutamine-hydrolysing)
VARDVGRQENAPPLPTFSQVFDRTPKYNERSFIEKVVAEGGIDPHFIAADDHAPLEHIRVYAFAV